MKTERRSVIKKLITSATALVGIGFAASAKGFTSNEKEVENVTKHQDIPLFSGSTRHGDIVYIAGKGAHIAPFEIKAHTKIVLDELEKELKKAGSSMNKVLQVNVFLNDIEDYEGLNEAYKGRFGGKPPVRTTIAVAKGGVPGDSLVEMNCIAYI